MFNFLHRFDYNYDFLSKRKIAVAISAFLFVVSLLAIGFRGLNFGIDFTGGTLVEVGYTQAAELENIRTRLSSNGFSDATVQNFGSSTEVLIRLGIHEEYNNEQLSNRVLEILKDGGVEVQMRRVEFVGPQVGKELVEDGGLAVIYTLIGILIYVAFRFEYRFAVGAIIALVHDTVITVGLFAVTHMQFDLTVLAAVLAVIGYSLNDTIVVFDRVRDNFLKMRKQSVEEIVNRSINQMLGRSVMTSLTTLLVLIVLFLLGGELIHGFATALIVGIVVGTYSSIYIASVAALALGINRNDLLPPVKEGADQPPQREIDQP
ncbi:protein translocase subunit SecF [Thioflexithrix psekupsensis]|uniref:Protein-export membrane protein SecF n=1 Tax=Thioflexithrix psekupsensis TaxID=1570016 RepID=A0A251XCN7_9GAMM|nr:protein translocase subunit SecF [Thioflexithrix psekupsensis]OUD16202.1 protein-export membrane protein SecF [Thioflexithrix psekupsensis]